MDFSPYIILGFLIVFSYFVGAIPFGYLAGVANGVDLRARGSGNIGATNVMRQLGYFWGTGVFILDFSKGFLPVYLYQFFSARFEWEYGLDPWLAYTGLFLVSLAAVLGHIYTCFLRFKGGKGVATTAGVIFALSPLTGIISLGGWLVVLLVSRYVSLASIAAALVMVPSSLYAYGFFDKGGQFARPEICVTLFLALVAVLVILKHRSNLSRIMEGTEPKVFSK